MDQRKRRFFCSELKVQAVDLVRQSGKGVKSIAQDLDVTETCLRGWVKQAESEGEKPLATERSSCQTSERLAIGFAAV